MESIPFGASSFVDVTGLLCVGRLSVSYASLDHADPNPEMNVWLSSGSPHLWHLGKTKPATDWEAHIDQLMQKQMIELNYGRRKRLYDQVQEMIPANLPFVFLAAPNILVGAKKNLENFKSAILEPTTLWNVEQLYFRSGGAQR